MRGRTAFLLGTVFCSGTAVMVVEMTAVRLIQPFFGSTTHVWTNVIAVVLAALSVGYAVGGRIADKRGSFPLLYGLLAVGGLLVLAVAPLATPVSKWLLPNEMHIEGVSRVLERGSLVATLLLFAPPVVFLGMVSPLAVKLLAEGGVGRAAGRVFAVGTVGSILGTYLPTIWLVPELGSRRSFMVAAALLLIPAAIGLIAFRRGLGRAAVLPIVIFGLPAVALTDPLPRRGAPVLPLPGGIAEVIAEGESPYQYLTIREDRWPEEDKAIRLLTINEGVYTYHSFEVLGQVLTDSRYYDDYAVLPMLLDVPAGEPLRGAVVGLAGGVTSRQWRHFWSDVYDVRVDGAEIDPLIVEWGREHFHLPPADTDWLRVYVMDGRQMLEAVPAAREYDMLVVDAFTNELYIPFHLGTREFFELCERKLAPGGILAMNVYASRPTSPHLLALQNTAAQVFGQALRVRQTFGGNFVLMTRKGAPIDVTRLAAARVTARFGRRTSVPEWNRLLSLAGAMPANSVVVRPDPRGLVLTDDHAPLERLMDEELAHFENRILGGGDQ